MDELVYLLLFGVGFVVVCFIGLTIVQAIYRLIETIGRAGGIAGSTNGNDYKSWED